jgi:hypothetical protein
MMLYAQVGKGGIWRQQQATGDDLTVASTCNAVAWLQCDVRSSRRWPVQPAARARHEKFEPMRAESL